MTNVHNLDLGKLTHKQTTLFALGVWRALRVALAAHAAAVGIDAAIEIRNRLVKDAKSMSTEGFSIDDEATALTALIASIDFSFQSDGRELR
jgi:hypothetical protein